MKKLLFLIMFIFLSCSPNIKKTDFNFSDDMSFNEIKIKLSEYSKNNPYPKIDE